MTISKKLIDDYLDKGRISIFLDEIHKKIGLKSNPNGQYKISQGNHRWSVRCTEICNLVNGYFYPEWSKKYKMLIFSYGD